MSCSSSMIKFLLLLSLSVILSAGTTKALVKIPPNQTVPAVFFLGDSTIDTGTNNGLDTIAKCNFPPYGRDFPGGLPSGRFSNGRIPPDFIAEMLGIKETVPPFLDPQLKSEELPTGVSFGSGCAGYDPMTADLWSVLPLREQLEYFKKYIEKLKEFVGEDKAIFIVANSLYFIAAGSNDLAINYYLFPLRSIQLNISAYTKLMVHSATETVQGLYDLGARRIGVFSLPPIGCVPSQRTLRGGVNMSCADNLNRAAKLFNKRLVAQIKSFSKLLPDSRVVYMDTYTPLNDIIYHPEKYGFEVVKKGCCGTGIIEVSILCTQLEPSCTDDTKYVFWDSVHPTERTYQIWTELVIPKYINKFF